MAFCSMMAGQMAKWTTLQLLIIFSLLSLNKGFEVTEEQWKQLGPEVTALHRLRRLSELMFTSSSKSRCDADRNPPSFLQQRGNFTACVVTKEQDLSSHLVNIEKEKRPQSTQYDHQQIIMLQDDEVVRKAATNLYEKHPAVSSVYVLDNNQRPKLTDGKSEPLSENSRLVLVGHGAGDASGEMRLSGYRAQDVARIIQSTSRVSEKIQATTVVACEVGSDEGFIESVLKELHGAGVETELHLWNTVVQVTEEGQIITEDASGDGLQWRYKDSSKKVVATMDRNGAVTRRHESGSKGEIIFTKERNVLMPHKKTAGKGSAPEDQSKTDQTDRFLKYRNSWPEKPQRFIDADVYKRFEMHKICYDALVELESLTWGMFHSDQPTLGVKVHQKFKYVIGRKKTHNIEWINEEEALKEVLNKLYQINSAEDMRKIIHHYAKDGEDEVTYLMVNDWIFHVDPKSLYVYPVGKRLDNNQIESEDKINPVKECIKEQIDKETYKDMKDKIKIYINILSEKPTTAMPLCTQAWFTTYFTASVIAESARNFRTFPLILMAVESSQNSDNNIKEKGQNFLLDDHSMARGGSWIDPSRRGFSGSATPAGSSKLDNKTKPKTKEELMKDLVKLIEMECEMFKTWKKSLAGKDFLDEFVKIMLKYKIMEGNENNFKENVEQYKKVIIGG